MADIVSTKTRSAMMSRIRGRDTKPELALRSGLHRRGFRFTVKSKLPGKPDMVLPRHRVLIFFHGCFWHGHEGCELFQYPATREKFWREKIDGNRARDARIASIHRENGWRVAVVRECTIRGARKSSMDEVCSRLAEWIREEGGNSIELSG